MAKIFKVPFLQTIKTEQTEYDDGDAAATAKTLFTASAEGGLVNSIAVTSTDTSPVIIEILVTPSGGVAQKIGEVNIPAGSGTDGTLPAINLLNASALAGSLQADGSLALEGAGVLSVRNKTQVTTAKIMDITAFCGDF